VLQQKCIGESFLGKSVSVRAACSPNSAFMKALRVQLSQPGVTLPKACMLCGGPDWPTSVLCGILRLNCCQMVVGLTPMWTMTIPSTLVGAFMTRTEPAALSNMVTFMAAIVIFVQGLFITGCVVYVRAAQTTYAKDIAAIPDDEEVKKYDARAKSIKEVRDRIIAYEDLPRWARWTLTSGTVLIVLTCYVLMLQPSRLFKPFSLTDCLDLLSESPYDTFIAGTSAPGLVALVSLLYSLVCYYLFSRWASRATAHAYAYEKDMAHELRSGRPVNAPVLQVEHT